MLFNLGKKSEWAYGKWVERFSFFPVCIGIVNARKKYIWLESYEEMYEDDGGYFAYVYRRSHRKIQNLVPFKRHLCTYGSSSGWHGDIII